MMGSILFCFTDRSVRMCGLKLTHVGGNYPCVTDPNLGPPLPSHTARVAVDNATNQGTIQFTMLSNWGNYTIICAVLRIRDVYPGS
jgi:hypothetical protein